MGQLRSSNLAKSEGAIQGNLELRQSTPEDRESRKLEAWSSAIPKARELGQPNALPSAPPKDAKSEETRRFIAGKAGGAGLGATQDLIIGGLGERSSGATRCSSTGTAERCEIRGNSMIPSPAQPNGLKIRGNSKIRRQRGRRMQRRGDPKAHHRPSRKMQETRQLISSSTR